MVVVVVVVVTMVVVTVLLMVHINSHFLLVTRARDSLYKASRSTEMLACKSKRHQRAITSYYCISSSLSS